MQKLTKRISACGYLKRHCQLLQTDAYLCKRLQPAKDMLQTPKGQHYLQHDCFNPFVTALNKLLHKILELYKWNFTKTKKKLLEKRKNHISSA
jgi:hypothetical protein